MYLQKVGNRPKKLRKKLFFFVDVLTITDENSRIRIRIRIRSISQKYGSADTYPDPYKNFMDPQYLLFRW
jgi:hypothetical protein